jgi:parallel beta-helix repeat protein
MKPNRAGCAWHGGAFTLGLLTLLIGWNAPAAWGAVLYVKADATGANNGVSWANAYTKLQSALAAAQLGDEIWVAAGTYKPTSGTDRTKSFVMKAGVAIYGGFAGTETARSQRIWVTNATILSGDIGVAGKVSDNAYHVVAGVNNAVLDGFTVTGGNAASGSWPNNVGGGMLNDSVSPTIANCTFSVNFAKLYGGGMCNLSTSTLSISPMVTNCTFSDNSADVGGGMFNNNASPTVTNCTFNGNSAKVGSGGGMNNYPQASPTVTNCVFSGNTASDDGGGMCNGSGSPTVTNCTFSGNSASDDGGGMYNYYNASPTVTNCAFSGNSASDVGGGLCNGSGSLKVTNCTFSGNSASYGGGMYNYYNASPTVTNCILWQNSATLGPEIYISSGNPIYHHCDIKGSGGSGAEWNSALGTDAGGNIDADPLFVDPDNPAGPDGAWRNWDDGLALRAGSPCINAGTSTGAPTTDILGNPRIGAPDIGAYEYTAIHDIDFRKGAGGFASFVNFGSVTPIQNPGMGICLEVPALGNNMGNWASPAQIISLVADSVWRIRVTVTSDQVVAGKVPLWDVVIDNWTPALNGPNGYGGDYIFLDNVGGANAAGSVGRTNFEVWFTPPAVATAQWNNASTAGAPFHPDSDPYNDMRMIFRVMDVDDAGINAQIDEGRICMTDLTIDRYNLSAMTAGTLVYDAREITNAATGGNFSVFDDIGGTVVEFMSGAAKVSPVNPSVGWTNSTIRFEPGDQSADVSIGQGVADNWPIPWEADTLYQVIALWRAESASDEPYPPDMLRLGMDSPQNELAGMCFVTPALGLAGMPKYNGGTPQQYMAFFYSHSASRTTTPNCVALRPRLDILNAANLTLGGVTVNKCPLRLNDVWVHKATFPND